MKCVGNIITKSSRKQSREAIHEEMFKAHYWHQTNTNMHICDSLYIYTNRACSVYTLIQLYEWLVCAFHFGFFFVSLIWQLSGNIEKKYAKLVRKLMLKAIEKQKWKRFCQKTSKIVCLIYIQVENVSQVNSLRFSQVK